MGQRQPETQTVTQTTNPPEFLQPHLERLFTDARSAADQVPNTPFQGDLVARPNTLQLGSLQGIVDQANQAQSLGQNTTNVANRFAENILGDRFQAPSLRDFDPSGAEQFVDAAVRPIVERYQEQIIPQLTSSAIASGAYGGGRDQLLQANLARDFSRNISDTTANVLLEEYRTNANLLPALLESEQRAATLLPSLTQQGFNLGLQPLTTIASVGDQMQMFNQQLLDEELARYNNAVTAPFQGLNQLAAVLGQGTGFSAGQSTVENANMNAGQLQNALLGGAGGGGIAMALGASNPITAGAVGLGALLGLFG